MANTPRIGEYEATLLPSGGNGTTIRVTASAPSLNLNESTETEIQSDLGKGVLKYGFNSNGTYTITGIGEMSGVVEIPSQIDGVDVTEIGMGAFKNCTVLRGIKIPATVTTIGATAFFGSGLETVTFESREDMVIFFKNTPGWLSPRIHYTKWSTGAETQYSYKMTHLDDAAPDLYCVRVPHEVYTVRFSSGDDSQTTETRQVNTDRENMPNALFTPVSSSGTDYNYTCKIEYAYQLPRNAYDQVPGALRILNSAFSHCPIRESVSLPGHTILIDRNAFASVPMKSVGLGSFCSITEISDEAFLNCMFLEEIRLPKSLAIVGANAFKGCISLNMVIYNRGLRTIGASAFEGCESLSKFLYTGADGDIRLERIGARAFANCYGLASPTGNPSIFSIPSSVTYIGKEAFSGLASVDSGVDADGSGYTDIYHFHAKVYDAYTWFGTDSEEFNPANAILIEPAKLLQENAFAIGLLFSSTENEYFTRYGGYHWHKLKKMPAPEVSLEGTALIMTDKLGVAEWFHIYVNTNTTPYISVNPKGLEQPNTV